MVSPPPPRTLTSWWTGCRPGPTPPVGQCAPAPPRTGPGQTTFAPFPFPNQPPTRLEGAHTGFKHWFIFTPQHSPWTPIYSLQFAGSGTVFMPLRVDCPSLACTFAHTRSPYRYHTALRTYHCRICTPTPTVSPPAMPTLHLPFAHRTVGYSPIPGSALVPLGSPPHTHTAPVYTHTHTHPHTHCMPHHIACL